MRETTNTVITQDQIINATAVDILEKFVDYPTQLDVDLLEMKLKRFLSVQFNEKGVKNLCMLNIR